MNSSVWVVWAAQGSKEKSEFEFSWATFEGGFFQLFEGKKVKISFENIVVSELKSCPK